MATLALVFPVPRGLASPAFFLGQTVWQESVLGHPSREQRAWQLMGQRPTGQAGAPSRPLPRPELLFRPHSLGGFLCSQPCGLETIAGLSFPASISQELEEGPSLEARSPPKPSVPPTEHTYSGAQSGLRSWSASAWTVSSQAPGLTRQLRAQHLPSPLPRPGCLPGVEGAGELGRQIAEAPMPGRGCRGA